MTCNTLSLHDALPIYVVSKTTGDAPETTLAPVAGDDRVAEIARILSGSATAASLAHAREMLGAHA